MGSRVDARLLVAVRLAALRPPNARPGFSAPGSTTDRTSKARQTRGGTAPLLRMPTHCPTAIHVTQMRGERPRITVPTTAIRPATSWKATVPGDFAICSPNAVAPISTPPTGSTESIIGRLTRREPERYAPARGRCRSHQPRGAHMVPSAAGRRRRERQSTPRTYLEIPSRKYRCRRSLAVLSLGWPAELGRLTVLDTGRAR